MDFGAAYAGMGLIFHILGLVYCIVTFYLAIVFIAKEDEVGFGQSHFGAVITFVVFCLLSVLNYCLPTVWIFLWFAILFVAVFLVYALVTGLIVKQAAVASVLFSLMFFPGFWGIFYFMHWLTTDAIT